MDDQDHDARQTVDATAVAGLLAAVVTAALTITGAVVGASAAAASWTVGGADRWWSELGELPDDLDPPAERTVVYDRHGERVATLHADQNRKVVEFDDLGQPLIDAVVATEDAGFFDHDGVEAAAITRAAVTNVRSGGVVQGGSTITQQYVKNLTGEWDGTLQRKAAEVKQAMELERRLSKEEILAGYLNRAYFGRGVYGAGAAAEYYFGTTPDDLTVGQAATLAGMLRSPEGNNPVTNPEAAASRRDVVLRQMHREGYIDREEARRSAESDLDLDVTPLPPDQHPLYIEAVKQELFDDPALGETRADRVDAVFNGGLRVHTHLDRDWQQRAEELIVDRLDGEGPMGGVLTLESSTGALRATAVGPAEFGPCEDDADDCDRTSVNPFLPGHGGSGRQAGSAFKPVVAAAAMAHGTPSSWETTTASREAIPGCEDAGAPWRPRNYDGGSAGTIDAYTAMPVSNNVYFAKLTGRVGPERVVETAQRLGLHHSNLPGSCAVGLGAGDVFGSELAAAYAALASEGTVCEPHTVAEVRTRDGDLVTDAGGGACRQRLDGGVAARVTDTMRGVVESGTGTRADIGQPVAGKTGTTDDHRDAWFVGTTTPTGPRGEGAVTTAVWVGYEQPQPMYGVLGHARVTGGTVPASMWSEYMRDVVDDDHGSFPEPPDERVRVPDVTGERSQRAVAVIESAGLRARLEEVAHWEAAGVVTEQDPDGGHTWYQSEVTVKVSDGTEPHPTVPEVEGLDEQDAYEVLEDHGYDLVTVRAHHTETSSEFGRVLRQQPDAGVAHRPDRPVAVVVGRDGRPRVPDVTGMPEHRAARELQSEDYRVEHAAERVLDSSLVGTVLDTDPSPGDAHPPGRSVVVTVGEDGRPEMPDVTGWAVEDAVAYLEDLDVEVEVHGADRVWGADADVVAQLPEQGVRVTPGDSVELTAEPVETGDDEADALDEAPPSG